MNKMRLKKDAPSWVKKYTAWINEHEPLKKLHPEDRKKFLKMVISDMAKQAGGMWYFWRLEDEEFVLEGWEEAVEDFCPQQILWALDAILHCKYPEKAGQDLIPRKAIEFKSFLLSGRYANHPSPFEFAEIHLQLDYDEEAALAEAEEKRKKADESRKEIKKIMEKMCINSSNTRYARYGSET